MSFVNKVFGFKRYDTPIEKASRIKEMYEVESQFRMLLAKDSFLSRRNYKSLVEQGRQLIEFLSDLEKNGILRKYAKKDYSRAKDFLDTYGSLCSADEVPLLFASHNDEFLRRHLAEDKVYLDDILKEIDSSILLDEDQRRVVLSDEDYTLVIAGAGAGKTTTIAAKVRYLVEKKGIDPRKILIVSFTNKAVNELKERINKGLRIDCPISTFHSAGYAILRKKDEVRPLIVDSGFLFNTVDAYLKDTVLKDESAVKNLVLFFGSYFDVPIENPSKDQFWQSIVRTDTSTLKGNMPGYEDNIYDRRTGKRITLNSEYVRSLDEVRIANFLFLNQIDYTYEEPYKYRILHAQKPYTPDFHLRKGSKDVYLEHFGISEDGKHSYYSEEELQRYKKAIEDKKRIHAKHRTTLLTTYSKYNDGRNLLAHLEDELLANGFKIEPVSYEQIYSKLVSRDESKYISKLVKLICSFIINFKTNNYSDIQFGKWRSRKLSERTRLFLSVAEKCYYNYQRKLGEMNAVDFEDMINQSAQMLSDSMSLHEKIDFDYIIVDEYQDISRQRFNLTNALKEMCDAKVIAVGDDWQSIYAYAGSDIKLFTDFKETMGYADILKIRRTYRNAQQIIDIAGRFIQNNPTQIKKDLISPKTISDPVIIMPYSEKAEDTKEAKGKGGKYYNIGKAINRVLEKISNDGDLKKQRILLVGRYSFDAFNLCRSQDFELRDKDVVVSKEYPDANLEFLTAHRSKGLGFDNVIIVNARDETYGFPSKIDTDPIFKLVIKEDHSVDYAEERRLFYVALTRTKRRVYIVCPEYRPSEFVRELVKDYPGVVVDGDLSDQISSAETEKNCPLCRYPLQLRKNRNLGFGIWMCTNEPELCSFITNRPEARNLQIVKCDQCNDGYLIVRNKQGQFFLGCTNYRDDRTGCSNTVNATQFTNWSQSVDDWNGFASDPSADEEEEHKGFCIRCGKPIDLCLDFDDPHPYCYSCYKVWMNEGRNENKIESFCHYCGKKASKVSFWKPLEWDCFKEATNGE